jgi:peptidoglycan/LPS O-acetylase OafA/YrhL
LLFLPAQLSLGTRLITALVAVVALLMIGGETARLFPVWLMGVAAYVLARRIPPSAGPGQMRGTAVTFLITAGVLSFVRVKATAHAMPWWDYIAGGCVAVLIYFLLSQSPRVHGAISRILHETAGSSFTLYVAHTPILALVATVVMDQRAERWPLTLGYFGCYLVIVAGVYVYAWLLAAVTERYTHRGCRDLLRRWVGTDGVTAARGGK